MTLIPNGSARASTAEGDLYSAHQRRLTPQFSRAGVPEEAQSVPKGEQCLGGVGRNCLLGAP
jgi:hypothetical protein